MPKISAFCFFLFFILQMNTTAFGQKNQNNEGFTMSGEIKDAETGESIPGAIVKLVDSPTPIGSIANLYGFYSLSLKPGNYTLEYAFTGYQTIRKQIALDKNITININLSSEAKTTDVVEIIADKSKNTENSVCSKHPLDG